MKPPTPTPKVEFRPTKMPNVTWTGILTNSPTLSMIGVLESVYSAHPKYVERIVSSVDGQPPRMITSTDCTAVISPPAVAQVDSPPAPASEPIVPGVQPTPQKVEQVSPPALTVPEEQHPRSAAIDCSTIKNPIERLACFDSTVLRVASPPPTQNSASEKGASVPILAANDEKVIFRWSGSTDLQTRPFHVDGPWEFQWNANEGYFSAELHRTSGGEAHTTLLANGKGSSSSYQPKGGDFYLSFSASHSWSARIVSLPTSEIPEPQSPSEEPLLKVTGDQTNLPPCGGASEEVKNLVENSALGKTLHITVFHVGTITERKIRDGMSICSSILITNAGERSYDFQFYRADGEIYVFGSPR